MFLTEYDQLWSGNIYKNLHFKNNLKKRENYIPVLTSLRYLKLVSLTKVPFGTSLRRLESPNFI